jgi:transcriptional regulator with XRE-family HTH domain
VIYQEIGRLVQASRKRAGLTQDKLSSRVGMTRTSITNIERGRQRLSVDLLYSLAEALSVDPRALLPTAGTKLPANVQRRVSGRFDDESLRALTRLIS